MAASDNHLRIDYVEFATPDVARAKEFYAAAFGWIFKDYGADYASFDDGRMTGGFFTAAPAPAGCNPRIVVFATDLEAAAARVVAAGGRLVKEPFEFPGGRRFHFVDPTGLELAVWSDCRPDGSKIT
jgi:predicted enzyme related to lactoylglutathione lyase